MVSGQPNNRTRSRVTAVGTLARFKRAHDQPAGDAATILAPVCNRRANPLIKMLGLIFAPGVAFSLPLEGYAYDQEQRQGDGGPYEMTPPHPPIMAGIGGSALCATRLAGRPADGHWQLFSVRFHGALSIVDLWADLHQASVNERGQSQL